MKQLCLCGTLFALFAVLAACVEEEESGQACEQMYVQFCEKREQCEIEAANECLARVHEVVDCSSMDERENYSACLALLATCECARVTAGLPVECR